VKVGAFPQREGGNIKSSRIPRRNFLIEHLTYNNPPPPEGGGKGGGDVVRGFYATFSFIRA